VQRQGFDDNYIKIDDNDFENRTGYAQLKFNDLHLELRSLEKRGVESFNERDGQNILNVKGLILSCVQKALSMVKNKEENTNKETDRVGLVLKLLHQEQIEGITLYLPFLRKEI
jgi:hypothetical protein